MVSGAKPMRGLAPLPPEPELKFWQPATGYDPFLSFLLAAVITLCGTLLAFMITSAVTREKTTSIIEVKAVRAMVQKASSKSRRMIVAFEIENATGQRWWSNDTVEYTRCPVVEYNIKKPIYLHSYRDAFGSSAHTTGMVTFCK